MENLKVDLDRVKQFVSPSETGAMKAEMEAHNTALHLKTGKGSNALGWVNLPSSVTESELADIEETAERLNMKGIQILVVIGIGGSYLGTRAVADALSDSFAQFKPLKKPLIIFAGQNISEDYHAELRELLKTKDYAVLVISKSGTTTEPALAFRLLKKDLEERYGKAESRKRIVAITDATKGALRNLAKAEGYKTFIIPNDIGGRYSVLTPVGLVALASAGFKIRQLVKGAADMEKLSDINIPFENNLPAQYAAVRNILYRKGFLIEILVNFNPRLHSFGEWWKQLYGESEGKEGKGIFPASVDFTSDLHSMGQYIQEGERKLFETVISVKNPEKQLIVPFDEENLDGLNFLSGKRISEVNKKAELGTAIAHTDGGVPNLRLEIPRLNEYYLGQLIYFFELACGMSGYTLGVNPFDQPGVEAYKRNMFALLEKPGFEAGTTALKARLK